MQPTTLVIPCFNEAKRLEENTFLAFGQGHPDVRLLFVDDGSEDDTLSVLQRIQREAHENVEVLPLMPNRGKAEAVRLGILHALETEPRHVGFWDADLATPLDALSEFLAVLDEHPSVHLVMGARVKLLGRRIERRTWRHYLGRVFATCASKVLGLAVYDTQCGAKLLRATDPTRELFAEPFLTRWIFDVEILARLARAHRRDHEEDGEPPVHEIPLREWRDVAGGTIRAGDFAAGAWSLFRIWRHYRPRKRVRK